MTNDTPDPQDADGIDDRDRRALFECMTVLPDGGTCFTVVGENDSTYRVNTRAGHCTCADHKHRDVHCKHIRRATFASGQRPIPPQVDADDVDELLGEHCEGPYYSRAGTASSAGAAADGSGARPVDPDGPATEPYGDDNYDDQFGPGGRR